MLPSVVHGPIGAHDVGLLGAVTNYRAARAEKQHRPSFPRFGTDLLSKVEPDSDPLDLFRRAGPDQDLAPFLAPPIRQVHIDAAAEFRAAVPLLVVSLLGEGDAEAVLRALYPGRF